MPERSTTWVLVSGIAAFSAFVVGGIAAEPAPPKPDDGEKPIASWSGRPFLPSSFNTIINKALKPENRDDLTMGLKLYHDSQVGNYAVMSYQTPGETELTGTLTCLPAPVEEEPNATAGFKVYLDTDRTEFLGHVPTAQTFEFNSEFAKDVCLGGLNKGDLPKFRNPV